MGGLDPSCFLVPKKMFQVFPVYHFTDQGPDLYEVNEYFVKPLTRAAGGMSYALMKHPQGLLCEVFISHAWAEGRDIESGG